MKARTLVGIDAGGELDAAVIALSCRSWRCTCCKWRLRGRNRARALQGARREGERTWFLTLTVDLEHPLYRELRAELGRVVESRGSASLTVREAGGRSLTGAAAITQLTIKHAAASWNRLRTALLREPEFRDGIEFYKALELTERGVAHLHVLVRRPGSSPWLMHYDKFRGLLVRAGFGPVTKVERVDAPDAAAHYVTKMTAAYTAKGMDEMPRWSRRGSWSRGWAEWVPPTRVAGFTWQLGQASVDFTQESLRASGFRVVDPALYRVPSSPGGAGGGLAVC